MNEPILGHVRLDPAGRNMYFDRQNTCLKLNFACSVQQYLRCELTKSGSDLLLKYENGVQLTITLDNSKSDFEKYTIQWKGTDNYVYMKDIVDTDSGGYWYGGPTIAQQKWPIARDSNCFSFYLPWDFLKDCAAQAGMERYWICSNGYAIFVPNEVPLWTEHTGGRLSLQAQINNSPYVGFFGRTSGPLLSYAVYVSKCDTLKKFHLSVHGSLYDKCSDIPETVLIAKPIWTTWAKYKEKVTQKDVMKFANEILKNSAPISQLELDDRWATHYGDFKFDKKKFPDIVEMCQTLELLGIRLTLWVHPFVNLDSDNAKERHLRDYYVKGLDNEPAVVRWWRKKAYIIDFTNPDASKWFHDQLEELKRLGVYSFKFDAGEAAFLPEQFKLYSSEHNSPVDYTKAYIDMAASFGSAIEMRVFMQSQKHAFLYRMLDRYSTWDNVGIISIIPTILNFSIHGYNHCLPDMIGGNGYNGRECEKELFLRWMQVNLYLIFMQFSYTPWQYNNDVTACFKQMINVRNEFVPKLIKACKECCEVGEPVIRPMWFLTECTEALTAGDQFLIADNFIVAPVVTKGVSERTVFIPEGRWQRHGTQEIIIGPRMIRAKADLYSPNPPLFERYDDNVEEVIAEKKVTLLHYASLHK